MEQFSSTHGNPDLETVDELAMHCYVKFNIDRTISVWVTHSVTD